MGVFGDLAEEREGVGHTIAPVAEDAGRSGARTVVGGAEHPVEESSVDAVVPLVDPQGFHHLVLILLVGLVQTGGPFLRRGDDLRAVVLREFHLGEFADAVLRLLEKFQQGFDRLAVDLLRRQKRAAFVGDAIDAAEAHGAVGVTEMVLQVADDRVVPVGEVEGAVGSGGDRGGTEVRVAGGNQILEGLTLQAGAFLVDLHAEDPLEADDVQVEEISLELVGEVAAGDHARAGAWARRTVPELLHAGMLRRVVDASAEGRAEVGVVAGGIGHEVVAPPIEDAAMGIGEAVGDVGLELRGERLVTEDGGVVVADGTGGGLDLGAVEDTVAEINRTAGIKADGVGGVVRVGGVEAHQDALPGVSLAVAIRIADEPHVRRLHDEHAVLVELEAGRSVQVVEELGHLVRLAVAIRVLEDEEAVAVLAPRRAFRVIAPRGDPEPALRVPCRLDRVDEIGELLFVGEEIHLHAGMDGHLGDRFLAVEEDMRAVLLRAALVRRHRVDGRQVVVVHDHVAAAGHGPDALLAIGGHDITHGHLLLHDLVVGGVGRGRLPVRNGTALARQISHGGTAAVDVVAVDRAVAGVPHRVLLVDGGAELFKAGGRAFRAGRRSGFTDKPLVDDGREGFVSGLAQEESVDRQGNSLSRGGRVELLARFEQIDKWNAVGLGDFSHRARIQDEVGVGRSGVREGGIAMFLGGDGREEDDARRTFAGIVLGLGFLQPLVQISAELGQPFGALERFVVAEEREDHVGLHPVQPVVGRAEILRAMAHGHFIAGCGEVAEDELVLGKLGLEECLQVAGVLHPVGQGIADEGHVIAGVQGKDRRLGDRSADEDQQGENGEEYGAHELNGFRT